MHISELEAELRNAVGDVPMNPRNKKKMSAVVETLRSGKVQEITLRRENGPTHHAERTDYTSRLCTGLELGGFCSRGKEWNESAASPLAGGLRITGATPNSPGASAIAKGILRVDDIVTKIGAISVFGNVDNNDAFHANFFPAGERQLKLTVFRSTAPTRPSDAAAAGR